MQLADGQQQSGTWSCFMNGGQGEVFLGHRHHRKSVKVQLASSPSAGLIPAHLLRLPKGKDILFL